MHPSSCSMSMLGVGGGCDFVVASCGPILRDPPALCMEGTEEAVGAV